jgi:uncharacterized protein YggE
VTDQASLILTADYQEPELTDAIRKATQAYSRASDAIRRLGLADLDLRTVEYSVSEVREWEKDKSVFKGFRARMGLRVSTSDIAKMGDVITIAAREDIHDVSELNTFLSSKKLRSEEELCLKDAAANAHDKAEKLASALGTHVGPVVSITEEQTPPVRPQPPRPLMRTQNLTAEVAPPPVESGTQDVNVSVTATFGLR